MITLRIEKDVVYTGHITNKGIEAIDTVLSTLKKSDRVTKLRANLVELIGYGVV